MSIEVLVFVTPSCPSCQPVFEKTDKVIEEIKKELNIPIEIRKVDVSKKENLRLALKYNVKSVPTVVVNGRNIIRGVPQKDELRKIIEKYSEF